jgi:hypothetical protein
VKDADGQTCLTRAQVDAVLSASAAAGAPSIGVDAEAPSGSSASGEADADTTTVTEDGGKWCDHHTGNRRRSRRYPDIGGGRSASEWIRVESRERRGERKNYHRLR